jgi:hypothetical protein
MVSVGWLSHHPSHAVVDDSTPVLDTELVFAIPSHIVECV